MTAITDLSDLVNLTTGGNDGTPTTEIVMFDGRSGAAVAPAPSIGRWQSMWRYNKSMGGAGVTPTTVAAPTRAMAGALPLTNPGGGRQRWLTRAACGSGSATVLMVYDRLLHVGSLDGTVTTAQTVGGSMTRYTSAAACVGNQIWIEIHTQIGTSATTITASYTNQDDNPATTPATAIGGTALREADKFIPLMLADGDTGVRGVTSVTLTATTGTAGAFGVVVARPIVVSPLSAAGFGAAGDLWQIGPREILTDACLTTAYMASLAGSLSGILELCMIEK